jgi:hypothetical protein
MRENGTSTI